MRMTIKMAQNKRFKASVLPYELQPSLPSLLCHSVITIWVSPQEIGVEYDKTFDEIGLRTALLHLHYRHRSFDNRQRIASTRAC